MFVIIAIEVCLDKEPGFMAEFRSNQYLISTVILETKTFVKIQPIEEI